MSSKQNLQTLRGFRDFLPKDALKRQYVIEKLRSVFELYGFEPLETPALEYEAVLKGKYGDEGDKLMYRFNDLGGRKVALRYDQTVPLARVVAQYPDLPKPFKRYQIQPVWRAENTQKGRYREFLQCDADIVGVESTNADIEILSCLNDSLIQLGFENFTILVNSRKVFEKLNIGTEMTRILDKEDKIGKKAVLEKINQLLSLDNQAVDKYKALKKFNPDEVESLQIILQKSKKLNLFWSAFLARGLDYYTDLIFEVKIPNFKGGSVCGGGRYDNLIGTFLGQKTPAVGFAFGFDRLINAMEELNLFPPNLSPTKILVTVLSPNLYPKSQEAAEQLRKNKISTDLYLNATAKLDRQLKYADTKGIPYVAIIGAKEAASNTVTLKNMATGDQKQLPVEALIHDFRP